MKGIIMFGPLRALFLVVAVLASCCWGDSSQSGDFPVFFSAWLRERWGSVLSDAVYDPHIFFAFRNGSWAFPAFDPIVGIQANVPPIPGPLSSTQSRLWYVKHHTSVVLGTICHDATLSALYQYVRRSDSDAAIVGSSAPLVVFRNRLAHLVDGHLRYTMLLISTIMEGVAEEDAEKARWQRMETSFSDGSVVDSGGHSPGLVLLRRIVLGTTPEDVRRWIELELRLGEEEREALQSSPVTVVEAANPYEVASRRFQAQMPLHEKYLYAFRGMISCHSLIRECEEPDGCRYLCNLPYLQHAPRVFSLGGELAASASDPATPFFHRFIGIGSRNEYNWELSMLRLFSAASSAAPPPTSASATPRNGLYSMSTFDCTVAWQPPPELTRSGTGWSRTSLCVSASMPKSIPMSRVLPLIEESERHDDGMEHEQTLRYPIYPMPKQRPPPSRRGGRSSSDHAVLHSFDDVSILKVDIEGNEYQFVHEWYRDYVASLSDPSTTSNNRLLSASQFLFEVHGGAASVQSVWRIHAMLMQMQRMGFLQVMMEINLWSSTAAEVAMVHFHYFVKSELWMALSSTMANTLGEHHQK